MTLKGSFDPKRIMAHRLRTTAVLERGEAATKMSILEAEKKNKAIIFLRRFTLNAWVYSVEINL